MSNPHDRETLSVLILAKNEEDKIAACLEQVAWADEVLVVDDLSTDRTVDICRRYGARVVHRRFDNFSDQANYGLRQLTSKWVLSLDADEQVTPSLREQIETVLAQRSEYVGFTFKRLNYFLGRRMRYGGWYHDVLHLFRRGAGQFRGQVHHAPSLTGRIGHLHAEVEHRPFQSIGQFVERQNRYTSMEAREWYEQHGNGLTHEVRRQLTWRPPKLFWKSYVKKQGFREGFHGFLFAVLFAWVDFLKWAKYWERCQTEELRTDAGRISSHDGA